MRATTDFARLNFSMRHRLKRLRKKVSFALTQPKPVAYSEIALAVVELDNAWQNFSRSFLISLPLRPKTSAGVRITLSNLAVQTPSDVLLEANRVHRGPTAALPLDRRDEPNWREPALILKTSTRLGPSNISNIQGALSLGTQVFFYLPPFRNFFAHRNEDSCDKALRVAKTLLIPATEHPAASLLLPAKSRPQAVLLDWIDEMEIVAGYMTQ